jgi:hypothetical protein
MAVSCHPQRGTPLDTGAKSVTDSSQVDTIEAGRVAFELSQRHGRNAFQHAAKLATEALAKGNTEDHAFWKYVEATLKPRSVGVVVNGPEHIIYWLRSQQTGRRFPTAIMSGDTDMVTIGWTSLSSTDLPEVVITRCSIDEHSNAPLLESRVNSALGSKDFRVVTLLRSVDNSEALKGLSFQEFRKNYRQTLYYRDILVGEGEAICEECVSDEDFVSAGGRILNLE